VIGLPEVHLESEALADDLAPFLDLRERRVTVDVRFALAEQIQVRAIQDQNRRHDSSIEMRSIGL
jgi:hypothetical protein